MNKATHRKYILEFDVWDPFAKLVSEQVHEAILVLKPSLKHAVNVHFTLLEETEL